MQSYDYISIAISAYLVIVGLASIFTHKVYGMGSSAAKYTEESLKKFSLSWGLSYTLGGAGLLAFDFLKKDNSTTGLIVMIALVAIGLVISLLGKKVLVKK